MPSQRHTKIVCTIGPGSNSVEQLRLLAKAGMNVARINFSHGTQNDHKTVIARIRQVAEELGKTIPILGDLQGPKIRVGTMKNGGQTLSKGSDVTLTTDESKIGTSSLIPIDFKNLPQDAKTGDSILMDDGLLELKIERIVDNRIEAVVIDGGLLKSRKGVNLPGIDISVPSLTEKDIDDLEFALSQQVDFVALSFVRSAEDIQQLISRLRAANSPADVIAKIEKPEAVNAIEEIIDETDGIMVARGDLGIEIPSERVPLIQKEIIDSCKRAGKPVITATQMLESMIEHPRATRAENSDVANAVLDGTDAVMLSGETAIGAYPVEAVREMDKICRSIENNTSRIYHSLSYEKPEWKEKQVVESIADNCVSVADNVDAKVIGTLTHSGNTARRIAKYRPKVPIVAFTENEIVKNQLMLVWGVIPLSIQSITDSDKSLRIMERKLVENKFVGDNDRIILTTGVPIAQRGRTNMITVLQVGEWE
ncbi:MAG TPA: pyruvate kinase [Balneolaceae bacterium]|nr:pyruvate kinase [Balneolaceae bacterium]